MGQIPHSTEVFLVSDRLREGSTVSLGDVEEKTQENYETPPNSFNEAALK